MSEVNRQSSSLPSRIATRLSRARPPDRRPCADAPPPPRRLPRPHRPARRRGRRRLRRIVVVEVRGTRHPGTTVVTSTTSASTSRPAPTRTDLTVEVNGDILVHSPVWERALQDGHGNYDFTPMLREIAPYIRSADLAICHVETPMTPRPPTGYPIFNTPTQLARAIKRTGWRICDTASNHSVDQGQYGIDQTGRALDRAGVLHTGSFASPGAQRRTLMVKVKGVKVAFLAYTEMTNGLPLPHPWSVNIATIARVRHDARVARRRGAQVVIVNFHWGDEFVAGAEHVPDEPGQGAHP